MQGLGKRVPLSLFRLSKTRTGKGMLALRLNAGDSLAATEIVGVKGKDFVEDALISTVNGMLLRVSTNQVPTSGRYAKGSRVVKVKEGDEVSAITLLHKEV